MLFPVTWILGLCLHGRKALIALLQTVMAALGRRHTFPWTTTPWSHFSRMCVRVYIHTHTHFTWDQTMYYFLFYWQRKYADLGGKIRYWNPEAFFLLFSVSRILFGFCISVSLFLIFLPSHEAPLLLCYLLTYLFISHSQIEHNPLAAVKVCSSLPTQMPTE